MDRILSLIEHYGYLVVLFGVMLESTGVPLPGETILLAAGVLVQRGHLDLGETIAFGILGAVLGDQIGYWVGREGGRPFVLRWGRYLFVTPERLARAEAFFARHGGKAVFLERFFSGLRVFGALVAGISRMRWLPSSSASIPLVTAITIIPGFSSVANYSPAQRTPKELTPLMAICASSNARSASSRW
jgi:membrane protein DedA with SNARE-associated domain